MYVTDLFAVLCISCGFAHVSGAKKSLTLLSIMPYSDSVPSLQPAITIGPEIEPVAELAVQQINNRSDLLSDYTLELVTADGGCNIPSKAIISVLSHVIHSGNPVAGIIGPLCSDASAAVGSLIRRPEISLFSVHRGNHFGLADRELYRNSLGIAWSALTLVDAFVALVEYNYWTNVAALYNNQFLVDYGAFLQFEKDMKNKTSTTIIFSSHTSPLYIPLDQLNEINVRVIFSFLREPLLEKLLCIAYHKEMIFPNYQWVVVNGIHEVREVEVSYEGENYACTVEQMINATNGMIYYDIMDSVTNTTSISGMNSSEFHSFHKKRLPMNTSSIFTFPTGRYYYDALWAIALALNNSLDALHSEGFNLSNYTYGLKNATDIILNELYEVNFQGISGEIKFNRDTGFCERTLCFEELFNEEYQQIGCYNNKKLEINASVAVFVPSEFIISLIHIRVSTVSVVIFILADFVAVVLIVTAHVINTTHRNIPSIKASSVRLNHFAYTGCYLILSAVVFYTVNEASDANEASKTVLCNFIPWCIAIGSTLVFGTVCAKTWRLYQIIVTVSSQKLQRAIKDSILTAVITVMTLFSVLLCSVWSAVDPLTRTNKTTIITLGVATVKEQCECNNIWVWLLLIFFYETLLLGSSSLFAVRAQNIRLKDFQTHGIVILSIVVLCSSVFALGFFFLTSSVDKISVDISYIFLCMVLCSGVYLCFFLSFFPPIRPVLMEKWLPVIRNVCGLQSRIVSSKCDVQTFGQPATVILHS